MSRNPLSRGAGKLLSFLGKRRDALSPLLILMHDFPDPDALASAYALQYIADRTCGIKSRIVYRGIIGRIENRNMVNFLELPVHRLKQSEIKKYKHVALVDTQPDFDNNPFPADVRAALIIDQHLPNSGPRADCTIIDTDCGATSVILTRAVLSMKETVPERLATALAYGIITDTLGLYRVKKKYTIRAYLDILPFANMHILARIQTPVHDGNYFTTLGRAILNAKVRDGLVVCHLGRVDNPDAVSHVAEFLLSYREAEWTLTTGRFKAKLHASLRTRRTDNPAGRVLRASFKNPEEAGGHDQIAGGSLRVKGENEDRWRKEEHSLQRNIVKLLKLKKGTRFLRAFKQDR